MKVHPRGNDFLVEVYGAVAVANTIAYISELIDPISLFLGLTRQNSVSQAVRYLLWGEGETGILVYRVHKAAFGDINPPAVPVPVRFTEFLRDTQEIGRGVVVGQAGWEALLEQNKQDFAAEFVARADFLARYPSGQTSADYVAALNANAGGALTKAEADDLAARLAAGSETRASVLRKIAEDDDFKAAESNRAFVLMEYFGYLRRDPDAAPDADFSGYDFWLAKLNRFGGDFRAAEMVRAFISSTEYRQRFGTP